MKLWSGHDDCEAGRGAGPDDEPDPMTVTFEKDPASSDRWLSAEAEGKPQLGAYMPASDGASLTVYWRGHVAMKELFLIVKDAQVVLANTGGDVQGTIVGYGKSREQFEAH